MQFIKRCKNQSTNQKMFAAPTLLLSLLLATVVHALPGDLDPSFRGGGKFTDWLGSANAVAIQADQKIVVGGQREPWSFIGCVDCDFRIARYNEDGSPDVTFGGGTGKIATQIFSEASSWAAINALATQPADGKIIAAGGGCSYCDYEDGGYAPYYIIVRYNTDGSLDPTFGSGGIVKVASGSGIGSILVLPDGKIVATSWNTLIQYTAGGQLDPTFGDGTGVATLPISANEIALQQDGKIVVVGQFNSSAAVVRCNANGTVDATFGVAGVATSHVQGIGQSLALQTDGKIVAAVHTYGNSNLNLLLARFNQDGSLDPAFGVGGIASPPSCTSVPDTVAIQANGKILVSASCEVDTVISFTLVRYNPDGTIDSSFSGDGIAIAYFEDYATPEGMALDASGRAILVGGAAGGFAIARFLTGPDDVIPAHAPFDFDGDGRSDISVFRPSNSVWYLNRSTEGFAAIQFGLPTDKLVPADYDGDGRTDVAVFRSGTWWVLNSATNSVSAFQFGSPDDIVVTADYTGDGRDDPAVYRNGEWWSLDLSNNQYSVANFGLPSDKPVPADYDGDGRVDQAVYRNGEWHILRSSQGYVGVTFGNATDRPVVGDYDGDGRADIAVFRDGTWYLLRSTEGFLAFTWGFPTDVPTPADYDGDGKTDAGVFRNGTWYLLQSSSGVSAHVFGFGTDTALEGLRVP